MFLVKPNVSRQEDSVRPSLRPESAPVQRRLVLTTSCTSSLRRYNVAHQYPTHTSTPRTFSAWPHFHDQIHIHKRSNRPEHACSLELRHFYFELARSCIMTWLSALMAATSCHQPFTAATLIFNCTLPLLLFSVFLGQDFSRTLCSKRASMAHTGFLGPPPPAKGFVGLP
jgi:hypothetical protein